MIESLRKLEKAFGGDRVNDVMIDETEVSLSGSRQEVRRSRHPGSSCRTGTGIGPPFTARPGRRKSRTVRRDPHWKDLVLFPEYFNGDNGEGLGAMHQTGWTGLVASLIDEWRGSAKRGAGE
jgi:hypothetical protein